MASKEKLLASAQKSLQKGQLSRAIKDYQKLVDLDPKDVRNRQKLAELYNRARMPEKALEEFEKVAKFYSENGFYLKAIAVYKQMQKLDPSLVNIYHRLAELNEKQGLNGNALAEYRNLVAYYEKQQMIPEAINVLQKMKELEPENLNIRVKIAETYAQANLTDKARGEFDEVLGILQQKKDYAKILKLYEIFLPMFPGSGEVKVGLAQAMIHRGQQEQGIQLLEEQLEENPDNLEILRVLIEGHRLQGDRQNLRQTYRQLLKKLPRDLELREGFILSCFEDDELNQALEELEGCKEQFFEADRVADLKGYYEKLKEGLPDNQRILATLHSIYELTGEGDKLFDIISSSEDQVAGPITPQEGATSPLGEETLAESIFDLASDDLEGLEGLEELEGFESQDEPDGQASPPTADEDLEEIPLEFLEEVEEAEPEVKEEDVAAEDELELEIELDLDLGDSYADLDLSVDQEEPDSEEVFSEAEADLGLDDDLLSLDLDDSPVEAAIAPDIGAELEEAEFYLQQGLLEDAERVCKSIVKADPGCEEAQAKLAEIAARNQKAAGDDEGDFADLASDIDILADEDQAGFGAADGTEVFGFADSQMGVETEIDVDDAESHYSLGIAYKEMGLLDDAVKEFDQAMKNPSRVVDCLTLKGVCLLEKGAFDAAEETLKEALACDGLSDEQRLSLDYELGLAYQASNFPEQALECFQRVADVDLFYRQAGEKLKSLREQLGLGPESDQEDSTAKGNKDRVSYV